MTVAGLRELEEMAVKLEAAARKLPMGPGRDGLLQDIALFRAQVSALADGSRSRLGRARGYRVCISPKGER